jgi:benzoyl-CoA reductase/2-hydroxyglutaryl-CoA dehydratase subunit BcrC/BadD/HgdB
MRRAAELIARRGAMPVFLMNVPSTWQTPAAQRLYLSELDRLGAFLVRQGGRQPSDEELAGVMLAYDDARRRLQAARGTLSARQYAEAVMRFHREGPAEFALPPAEPAPGGVPLAIVGGPLLRMDTTIFEQVEASGGRLVLDATETGERTMPAAFDRRRVPDDPRMELAGAYFGSIPDAFRRPNSELYRWLKRELTGRDVRGIIFRRYVWCDIWHAELGRLRDWTRLPVLDLDVGGEDGDSRGRTAGRIQAFLEMLT